MFHKSMLIGILEPLTDTNDRYKIPEKYHNSRNNISRNCSSGKLSLKYVAKLLLPVYVKTHYMSETYKINSHVCCYYWFLLCIFSIKDLFDESKISHQQKNRNSPNLTM